MGIIDEYMKELEEERLETEKESTDRIRMSELVPKNSPNSVFPQDEEISIPQNSNLPEID